MLSYFNFLPLFLFVPHALKQVWPDSRQLRPASPPHLCGRGDLLLAPTVRDPSRCPRRPIRNRRRTGHPGAQALVAPRAPQVYDAPEPVLHGLRPHGLPRGWYIQRQYRCHVRRRHFSDRGVHDQLRTIPHQLGERLLRPDYVWQDRPQRLHPGEINPPVHRVYRLLPHHHALWLLRATFWQ